MRLLITLWILFTGVALAGVDIQDTVYNYGNNTVYIHIADSGDDEDVIIALPFNAKYTSGAEVPLMFSPPDSSCQLVSANSSLYSVCADSEDETYLALSLYNSSSNGWNQLDLQESIPLYNGSSYVNTFDDPTSLYIFGGYDSDSEEISGRMLRVDLGTLGVENVSTSVQPSPFYGASSLKINYNTELLIGGKVKNGWIGLSQLALWQYGSWAFKSVNIDTGDTISSRMNPLVLPIFDGPSVESASATNNFTAFTVNSVLMMGGQLLSSYSNPGFAVLNISQNTWGWTPMDTEVSIANARVNSQFDDNLALEDLLGAAIIYDTLVVVTNNSGSAVNSTLPQKRSQPYYLKLYDTSDFGVLSSVDYTSFGEISNKKQKVSNKSAVIALSTIIPILMVIIAAVLGFLLYKRYRKRKEEEENEREMKDIMEFYKTTGGNYNSSSSSFGSDLTEKPRTSQDSTVDSEKTKVKVNNFDDGDNLSISSWRRKREMYEKQKKFRIIPSLKPRPAGLETVSEEASKDIGVDHEIYDEFPTIRAGGSLLRRLSTLSSQFGRSLRRSFSYQSSVRSYNSAIPEREEFEDTDLPESPIRRPVSAHSPSMTRKQSNSNLYLIPEDSSVSTFHCAKISPSRNSLFFHSADTLAERGSPERSPSQKTTQSPPAYGPQTRKPLPEPTPSKVRYGSNKSGSRPGSPSKSMLRYDPFVSPFDNEVEPDENMDVQILVSSKRRSKLRVTNPDPEDEQIDEEEIEYEEEPISSSALNASDRSVSDSDNTRKRTVSDESKNQDNVYE
ncbi:DEKNAAC104550 [Brettanomyces naardenensis]|uniref:DEKNAAC104550 n=1 Tax=Brettanomyces naardenensis TaxID=13370 RepID=A0A448YRC5_BRENA|nr:DEKNAAC104550 [Brettanomyces naardenensis]